MSIKNKLVVFSMITCAILGASISGSAEVSAANYIITVDDSAASKNQNIIFEEREIGPNFSSESYPIIVNNQSSGAVKIELISIEPASDNANTLLPAVNIYFSDAKRNNNMQGKYDTIADQQYIANCILPNSEVTAFYTGFSFDKSYGNEYQQTSFKLTYTFLVSAEEQRCPDEIEPPAPPDTGDMLVVDGGVTSGLAIIFAASFVSVFVFLLLMIKKRKKTDKKD